MASHLIQGREVTLPVKVADATACAAIYTVRADAARAVLAYSPDLDVTEVLPGKALCVLGFIRYDDGDLGAYNEFGVGFMVRPADAHRPSAARNALHGMRELRKQGTGAFVHWLPVDQRFTMEAGRSIWGFPKELAEIDLRMSSPYKRCILRKDGRLILDLLIRPGMPVPPGSTRLDAYTHLDGTTRRVRWTTRPQSVRSRPGGALIRLGNHPIAKELSELGLPKHALLTTTITHMTMTFAEPETIPRS
ncbi:acetoacetate decarboxylase family protein [Sphaerisporangium sp. NPDC051017]|uniref:acetoacetate decarboxylase family protein n=1 Tax=Sphaerisporangium sp. NPDC051017 TaxID=3154636 RepID=UPI003436FDAD